MRKVRTDKKRDVKPTLSNYVKENLYHFAYLTDQPVKDAGFVLIKEGLRDGAIIETFQPLMISNFNLGNHFYFGDKTREPTKIYYRGHTGKVTIKFTNDVYDELRRLAFAIGLTPTSTAALLIRKTLYNLDFMDEHKNRYFDHLGKERFLELDKFIRKIRSTIPKKWPPF